MVTFNCIGALRGANSTADLRASSGVKGPSDNESDDAAGEDPVERAKDDERARMCRSEQCKEHSAGAKARQEVCSESANAVACVAGYDSTEGRRCVDDCKLRVMDEQGEDRV